MTAGKFFFEPASSGEWGSKAHGAQIVDDAGRVICEAQYDDFPDAPEEADAALRAILSLLPNTGEREKALEAKIEHCDAVMQLLADIFSLLPPAPMQGPDGKVYEYHDPQAAKTLLILRKRLDEGLASIRALKPTPAPVGETK